MNTAIQTNIKKQLAKKNMSAAELERRTGIPHAVVNILHGRSKNPSLRTAQAIAKELGCSVEELLNEHPEVTAEAMPNAWNGELYQAAANAVCNEIARLKLQPSPHAVAECITEVYVYAQGSPTQMVDQRFAAWIVNKKLS